MRRILMFAVCSIPLLSCNLIQSIAPSTPTSFPAAVVPSANPVMPPTLAAVASPQPTQVFIPSEAIAPTPLPTAIGGASGRVFYLSKGGTDLFYRYRLQESFKLADLGSWATLDILDRPRVESLLVTPGEQARNAVIPSPQGSKLLIVVCTLSGDNLCTRVDNFTANLDLSQINRIQSGEERIDSYWWSPDGSAVAGRVYDARDCAVAYALVNSDGSGFQRFGKTRCDGSPPIWSMDNSIYYAAEGRLTAVNRQDLAEQDILVEGWAYILGSSRGNQDIGEMVDTLEQMNIGILFTIGGDGTLRGASAISEDIERRKLKIAVIGVPKTIDNDISYIQRSFGFATAVSEAGRAITSAHIEAQGARNRIGLVKLMGRESGFIATYAALAYSDVNFCLIPEVPFTLESFLKTLSKRLERKDHAVIVVAEGAGQDILAKTGERDASGNIRFQDIGIFLRDQINAYFKRMGTEFSLKYIDPSYTIRSVPADANDSAFCLLLGQNAVHAGMAGRTNMVVGFWGNDFTHVPIPMATSKRKKVDPEGWVWNSVLTATGQPREMR